MTKPIEYLYVVDENDTALIDCKLSRDKVHQKPPTHWHRTSAVIISDSTQAILCHRRALTKEHGAGMWCHNVGGHYAFGEAMYEGAIREVKEEIGIDLHQDQLEFVGKEFFPEVKHVDYIFLVRVERDSYVLKPDPTEVMDLRWITLEEIDQRNEEFSFPLYEMVKSYLSPKNIVNG